MGIQLGPGFLRRRPRGWLAAEVSAVAHRAWEPGSSGPDGGQADIDTSCLLDARWRVELPGREPYEFDEQRRRAPTWVLGGAGIGAGRRWYKVRLAPTYGLMDGVADRCRADSGAFGVEVIAAGPQCPHAVAVVVEHVETGVV